MVYQTITGRKKYWHFSFFIVFLDSLGGEDYIAWKKKKKACSEIRKFGTFWFFFHVRTCCALVMVLLNFEMSWHSTFPTKNFSIILLLMGFKVFHFCLCLCWTCCFWYTLHTRSRLNIKFLLTPNIRQIFSNFFSFTEKFECQCEHQQETVWSCSSGPGR